jgi:hypothetical protein
MEEIRRVVIFSKRMSLDANIVNKTAIHFHLIEILILCGSNFVRYCTVPTVCKAL